MSAKGVGIDIVDSHQFDKFKKETNHPFIIKNFSLDERTYCLSFQNPSPHFAGIFAAKEAVSKALGESTIYLPNIEIRHNTLGRPVVYRKRKKLISVLISITHTDSVAAAIAIRI